MHRSIYLTFWISFVVFNRKNIRWKYLLFHSSSSSSIAAPSPPPLPPPLTTTTTTTLIKSNNIRSKHIHTMHTSPTDQIFHLLTEILILLQCLCSLFQKNLTFPPADSFKFISNVYVPCGRYFIHEIFLHKHTHARTHALIHITHPHIYKHVSSWYYQLSKPNIVDDKMYICNIYLEKYSLYLCKKICVKMIMSILSVNGTLKWCVIKTIR